MLFQMPDRQGSQSRAASLPIRSPALWDSQSPFNLVYLRINFRIVPDLRLTSTFSNTEPEKPTAEINVLSIFAIGPVTSPNNSGVVRPKIVSKRTIVQVFKNYSDRRPITSPT